MQSAFYCANYYSVLCNHFLVHLWDPFWRCLLECYSVFDQATFFVDPRVVSSLSMHTLSAILVLWKKLELGVIAVGGSPVGDMCFLLDFDAKSVNDTGVFNWRFFIDFVEGFVQRWLSVTNLELQTKQYAVFFGILWEQKAKPDEDLNVHGNTATLLWTKYAGHIPNLIVSCLGWCVCILIAPN